MSIQLVTYANQTVTPTNDAIIYERAIDQNGIFYGCNVTVSGNEVHITGGYGMVCGREFTIQSEAITVTLAPSGTLDGRLYVRLDLADADNPIQLLTATGNTLPPLEQDDDVNYTNGTYEMELATFTVGVSALSDVVETFETIVGTETIAENTMKTMLTLLWTNPSGASSKTATKGEGDITLDQSASGYRGYMCEFRCVYNDGTRMYDTYFPTTGMSERTWTFATDGNPFKGYTRYWYLNSSTKMWFSDCTRVLSNASPVTGQDTGCLVPLRIWGIK